MTRYILLFPTIFTTKTITDCTKAIYPRYKEHYLKIANAISVAIGDPVFSGGWQDEAYPEWAVGEHVTVWEHNHAVLWLRLHHEDRECPIVIALAAHVT